MKNTYKNILESCHRMAVLSEIAKARNVTIRLPREIDAMSLQDKINNELKGYYYADQKGTTVEAVERENKPSMKKKLKQIVSNYGVKIEESKMSHDFDRLAQHLAKRLKKMGSKNFEDTVSLVTNWDNIERKDAEAVVSHAVKKGYVTRSGNEYSAKHFNESCDDDYEKTEEDAAMFSKVGDKVEKNPGYTKDKADKDRKLARSVTKSVKNKKKKSMVKEAGEMASMVSLKQIIDSPGKYKTRSGETVTINRIDKRRDKSGMHSAYGQYENGTKETWDVSGRLLPSKTSNNDIVKKA